jgi:hypothetical protein
MHEEYLKDSFRDLSKVLFIVKNEEERDVYISCQVGRQNKAPIVAHWNEILPVEIIKNVRYLRIHDPLEKHKELPLITKLFTDLDGLEIPAHLISLIYKYPFCLVIEDISVTTEKTARIPQDIIFESVRILSTIGGGPVIFDKGAFPNLRKAHIQIDRKGKILDVIMQIKGIEMLGLAPLRNDLDVFNKINKLPLKFLRLNNGRLDSLEGIQTLNNLKGLWLQNLTRIVSIRELKYLDNLEELTIGYCRHIKDIQILLELKSLNKVHIFGCGDLGIDKMKDKFEKKGFSKLAYN